MDGEEQNVITDNADNNGTNDTNNTNDTSSANGGEREKDGIYEEVTVPEDFDFDAAIAMAVEEEAEEFDDNEASDIEESDSDSTDTEDDQDGDGDSTDSGEQVGLGEGEQVTKPATERNAEADGDGGDGEKSEAGSEYDKKLAAALKELATLKALAADLVKAHGVSDISADGLIEALIKTNAEMSDVSVDTYKAKLSEREKLARADEIIKAEEERTKQAAFAKDKAVYDAIHKADLSEIMSSYPGIESCRHISQIHNYAEFARLRSMGLSAKQAYIAANPELIRQKTAQTAAQTARSHAQVDTKTHLQSAVSRSAHGGEGISKAQLSELRKEFPEWTDKDIIKYAQRVKKSTNL